MTTTNKILLLEQYLESQFSQLIDIVQVDVRNNHNLKDVFMRILNKLHAENEMDLNILDNFGIALTRSNKLLEAFYCFQEILKINYRFLVSYLNMDDVRNQLIERWHFRMLNDQVRNGAYERAIKSAIEQIKNSNANGQCSVLDIGTGTGLLAVYAYEHGATNVNACDDSEIMLRIAKEIFDNINRNTIINYMRQEQQLQKNCINLISKHSKNLTINDFLPISVPSETTTTTGTTTSLLLTESPLPEKSKIDLIVTEIFDCGVFGEGILQTLLHAKEHLLQEHGKIIPHSVNIYICGFESRSMAYNNVCMNNIFNDGIYLKDHKLVVQQDEPYDSENVQHLRDFLRITKSQLALTVNFNNLQEIKDYLDGTIVRKIQLETTVKRYAYLDGFCVWFELNLDDNNRIQNSPWATDDDDNDRDSDTETDSDMDTDTGPGTGTGTTKTMIGCSRCWDQAIFKLNHRYEDAEKLKYLNVTLTCTNGILNVEHSYNYTGKTFPISKTVMKFINDLPFLSQLEYEVMEYAERKNNKKFDIVMDFSPFPYVGICLMKEKRTRRLYCSRDVQDIVCFVAICNCIPYENIIFIDDPNDCLINKTMNSTCNENDDADADHNDDDDNHLKIIDERFDLIILSVINSIGCINPSQLVIYNELKTMKLNENGIIIPARIELWGELIYSEWLKTVGRCTNRNLNRYQINDIINQFETIHQLDLFDFEHEKISYPFHITDIRLDENSLENILNIGLRSTITQKPIINGMLYYFKLHFTTNNKKNNIIAAADADDDISIPNCLAISTNRNNSFTRRACFVFNNTTDCIIKNQNIKHCSGIIKYKAKIHFLQNRGIIKCSLR